MLAYPNKPFDRQAAIELQRRLWTQSRAQQLEQAKKRTIEQQKLEKESVELHRKLAEAVLGVVLLADMRAQVEPIGEIGWNDKIRDVVTGVSVGSPRTLMAEYGFEWVETRTPAST